jgi:hypothetical protein
MMVCKEKLWKAEALVANGGWTGHLNKEQYRQAEWRDPSFNL